MPVRRGPVVAAAVAALLASGLGAVSAPAAAETETGTGRPVELAHWPLEESASGVSPEVAGGIGLTLGGGATIYQPDDSCDPAADPDCDPPAEALRDGGHLELDGTGGYATRAVTGPLSAHGSFTLTARARLASANPTEDETVVALTGTNGSAIRVRYAASAGRWQLVVTDGDSATPVTTTLLNSGHLPSSHSAGDHLGLVYDAVSGDVLLYVNAVAVAETAWDNTWDFSTTSLQVGRNLTGTTAGEYFSGAIDEIRIYQDPLDANLMSLVSVMGAGGSFE
ncbi:LamG-like jellyroll fold domain-containing protein [Streptomyces sp. NPDC090106]|uniref:LamG-like jellyroll fold domain-containing protein n=1 Tax=Streptomyces sp. NPDC090106 TaxID=3365946 RepID=UPI0038123B2E